MNLSRTSGAKPRTAAAVGVRVKQRRAFLQDSWRTDSIAAVVWLEFLWAARSGLWLHTCHAPRCTQAFLARDG